MSILREMKKPRRHGSGRRALQGRSRGFSLIEVVIAIALLGIIGLSILTALSTASLTLVIADQRATAESLAESQIEFAKNHGYDPAEPGGVGTYDPITDVPDGYSISSMGREGETPGVVGVPWDSGNNTAVYEDNGLQRIKVIVTYNALRADNTVVQKQYVLEAYVREDP